MTPVESALLALTLLSAGLLASLSLAHARSRRELARLRREAGAGIADWRRLERERERFFTMSLDMQCVCGFDGKFKSLNPAWESTLGITVTELLSRPFLDFVHPEDRSRTVAEFEGLLAGGTVVSFENRYRCADGSFRWLLWSSVADAESGLIYATARDVTVKRKLIEDTVRACASAEATNKELEAFSYSVSHDLRAPLRSIDGFSQALLEDCAAALDDGGREHLGRIREAARRMGHLIDDLLTLSRISRAEARRERVDLSALARAVAHEATRREPERKLSFEIEPDLAAMGDPRLLRIMLDNLVGNAVKFTRRRPLARIEIGSTRRDGVPAFVVRDNGAGFDMSYASKLFGPFQRLHPATEFEGTGIGLATVARIVHRLGGRVWAEGAVDDGASFYFTLAVPGEGPSHDEPDDSDRRGQSERRDAEAPILQAVGNRL
ncbi:MAG TPA: ATP-binding protein [Verrucomicrobiae bacterium]|nr:ATP-binding protein [Verrucomicrobiae bacterium]